jgi:hypothetical protein
VQGGILGVLSKEHPQEFFGFRPWNQGSMVNAHLKACKVHEADDVCPRFMRCQATKDLEVVFHLG